MLISYRPESVADSKKSACLKAGKQHGGSRAFTVAAAAAAAAAEKQHEEQEQEEEGVLLLWLLLLALSLLLVPIVLAAVVILLSIIVLYNASPPTLGGVLEGGGGGGRGGIPASFPSRSPPPKQPFQPTPTPLPGSDQEVCENRCLRVGWFLWGKGPRPLVGRAPNPGGPGPKPPGDLAHRPLGPGSRHSHRLTSCGRVFNLRHMRPGLKTLGCYHNPQSADLGGRWMVSEGGALQFHERRGSRLRSNLANKPLNPASRQPSRVKNSKNAPVLIG